MLNGSHSYSLLLFLEINGSGPRGLQSKLKSGLLSWMKSHVGTHLAGLKSIHPEGGDPGSLTLNVCRSWRWPLVRRGQMFWDVPPVWTGVCAGCFSIIHHTDVTSHHLTVVFINEKAWKMNGHSWLDVISTSCCMCGQTVTFVFLSLAWRRFLFSTGLRCIPHAVEPRLVVVSSSVPPELELVLWDGLPPAAPTGRDRKKN